MERGRKEPKDNKYQMETKMNPGWLLMCRNNLTEDARRNWWLNRYSNRGRNYKRKTLRTFRTGACR